MCIGHHRSGSADPVRWCGVQSHLLPSQCYYHFSVGSNGWLIMGKRPGSESSVIKCSMARELLKACIIEHYQK